MATLPHVLLVPGFWEGPSVYDALLDQLRAHKYRADVIPLQSTGCKSPGNPSMRDDVAYIRKRIHETVEAGACQEVVLVLHSAGGLLGSMAIEGLGVDERRVNGEKGGVIKIVFLAGAILPEGVAHRPLPFFDFQVCDFFGMFAWHQWHLLCIVCGIPRNKGLSLGYSLSLSVCRSLEEKLTLRLTKRLVLLNRAMRCSASHPKSCFSTI